MSHTPSSRLAGITVLGLMALNLILTATFVRPDTLSNDDFYPDPGHLYVKDGRYAVIPLLTLVDLVFESQHHARTLGWLVMAVGAALAAFTFARVLRVSGMQMVVVSLLVSISLITVPNYYWAPALWYNALAFHGLAAAFVAIDATLKEKKWGVWGWGIATAVTFWSYQPFALIPLGLWVVVQGRSTRAGGAKAWSMLGQNLIPPLIVIVSIAAGTLAMNAALPSSRLEGGLSDRIDTESLVSLWMFSYGRSLQVVLLYAMVIIVVGQLAMWLMARTRRPLSLTLHHGLVIVAGGVGLAAAPLVFADASEVRFATAMQLAVFIVWLSSLVATLSDSIFDGPAGRITGIAIASLVAGGAASGLLALNSPTLAAVVGLAWALLVGGVVATRLVGPTASLTSLVVVGLLGPMAVALSLTRADLTDRWFSLEADRALVGNIVVELARLDFPDESEVTVALSVDGPIRWYSPLFRRVEVGGTEIVEQFARVLAGWTITVVPGPDTCEVPIDDVVTAVRTGDRSAQVCVVFREPSPRP